MKLKIHINLNHIVFLIFQVDIDFSKEPIGIGKNGKTVYLRDIWPSNQEISEVETQQKVQNSRYIQLSLLYLKDYLIISL